MSYMEYHETKQEQSNPPEEKMISADALKKQINKTKRCFHSENSDYMTGYISALSVVEGIIACLEDGGLTHGQV